MSRHPQDGFADDWKALPGKIRSWFIRRFGKRGGILFAFLVGLVMLWSNWGWLLERPGVRSVFESLTREPLPKADARRFSVAVTRLDGDPGGRYQRLIVSALDDLEGIQLIVIDRIIPTGGAVPETTIRRGHGRAREYLRKTGASLLVWGSVLQLEGRGELDLALTTAGRDSPQLKTYPRPAGQEFRLPQGFWRDLSHVLRLLIMTKATEFRDRPGRPVAAAITPFVEQVRRLLRTPPPEWSPAEADEAAIILADSLRRIAKETGDAGALREAVSLYERVLGGMSSSAIPAAHAALQRALGAAYGELGDSGGGVAAYRSSLEVLTAASRAYARLGDRFEWAITQHELANAMTRIAESGEPDGGALIDRAIGAYEAALAEFDEREHALSWGLTHNDLGLALKSRAERTQDAQAAIRDLERATAHYRAALRALTYDAVPEYWAAATVNLGIARMMVGEKLRNPAPVEEAIAALADATRVYSQSAYPARWGELRNSTGNAQAILGEMRRDPRLLRLADSAYADALHVRRGVPLDWADTQYNRGITLASLGRLTRSRDALLRAEAAFEAARRIYRREGQEEFAVAATARLAELRALLAAAAG